MRYQIYEAKSVKYDAQQRVGIISESEKSYSHAIVCPYAFVCTPPDEFNGDRLDQGYTKIDVSCSVS